MTDIEQKAMREAVVVARIYDQEGNLQPFDMPNTTANKHFAEWLRIHDRYTPRQEQSNAK